MNERNTHRIALGMSSGSWKDRPNHRALCVASSSKASSHCGTVIQYVIRGCACVCACSALLCSALLCSALLTSMSRVVVGNWKREIQNWCPSLRVVLYHGAQAERAKLRKSMVQSPPNVIITTYSVAFRKQDRLFFKKRLNFSYLVLGTLSRDTFAAVSTDRLISISVSHIRLDLSDEAQSVKNAESIRHRFLTKFSSERRLLLTGTPLQNNMTELWALLEFLMPDIFARFRKKNPVRVNQ